MKLSLSPFTHTNIYMYKTAYICKIYAGHSPEEITEIVSTNASVQGAIRYVCIFKCVCARIIHHIHYVLHSCTHMQAYIYARINTCMHTQPMHACIHAYIQANTGPALGTHDMHTHIQTHTKHQYAACINRSAEDRKGHIVHFRNPRNLVKANITNAVKLSNESASPQGLSQQQQQQLLDGSNVSHTGQNSSLRQTPLAFALTALNQTSSGQIHGKKATDAYTEKKKPAQKPAVVQHEFEAVVQHEFEAVVQHEFEAVVQHEFEASDEDEDDVEDSRDGMDAEEVVYTWDQNPLMVLPNQFIHCESVYVYVCESSL
jgi:hypothetical protein